jgi:hypothetical protein
MLAILLVPLAVALVLTLFAWPSARQEPRDLPVGVAGPPAAAQAMEKQLTARDGAFDVQRYPDEAAARAGSRIARSTGRSWRPGRARRC